MYTSLVLPKDAELRYIYLQRKRKQRQKKQSPKRTSDPERSQGEPREVEKKTKIWSGGRGGGTVPSPLQKRLRLGAASFSETQSLSGKPVVQRSWRRANVGKLHSWNMEG